MLEFTFKQNEYVRISTLIEFIDNVSHDYLTGETLAVRVKGLDYLSEKTKFREELAESIKVNSTFWRADHIARTEIMYFRHSTEINKWGTETTLILYLRPVGIVDL